MTTTELPADLSSDEARIYVVTMLDACRKAEQAAALNKVRFMLLAHRYGLSCTDIAEFLGMSESGVRQAIKRAEESPSDGSEAQ